MAKLQSVGWKSGQRVARAFLLSVLALAIAEVTRVIPMSGQSASQLDATLRGLFLNHEYSPKSFGPARWLNDGAAYVTVEPSAAVTGASDIVRYDTTTGNREVMVSAAGLKPAGSHDTLKIENYEWSADMKRLLIFTNSARVWRQHTRGDYWVLDRGTKTLHKLGGDAPESSLMFAKLSPDGTRAAYVRSNDLICRGSARLEDQSAHARRVEDDHQRNFGLGLRGRVRRARRLPLEP